MNTNMNLVGNIPVKPYIAKFVYHLEYLEVGKALDLENNSLISYTLKMLLTNKTNINHNDHLSYDQINKTYTAKLRFKISSRMQVFNCFYYTRKTIGVFNRFLERLFHEHLLQLILRKVAEGENEKAIIYQFMKDIDIEEDITFDTIKKASYRLRDAKKIPTIHQQ